MKKLLNLIIVVALAIGFVSCEQMDYTDRKYQNKLEGEWNLTLINGTLLKNGVVVQEATKSIPDEASYKSIKFNFKKDGMYVISALFASEDMEPESESGRYSVVGGKLALYESDDLDEPIYFDIVDISNKNLILKASVPYDDGVSATYELHLDKL